jgi:hypothetical protein
MDIPTMGERQVLGMKGADAEIILEKGGAGKG